MHLCTARIAIAALCASGALIGGVHASMVDEFVIDQQQPLFQFTISNLPPNASRSSLWQSFEPSSAVVSGAGMFLSPGVGTSGPVRIELWDGAPDSATGERLALKTGQGTAGTWVDVFWTEQAVTPGHTYFLLFEGMGQPGTALALGGAGNLYPHGSIYLDGQADPRFDATFRTYGPAIIPEPASALLLLAGLAGLVAVGALRAKRTRDTG
jgi:hypothetical protein